MIVRAPRPQGNFYLLDKRISEDKRLSWAARGLLVFLLGKPDYWQVSVAALVAETSESGARTGRDGVYALLKELMHAGYLQRDQARAEDGRMGQAHYVVSEVPAPRTAEPDAAPLTAQPYTVDPTQVSIEKKQGLKGGGERAREDADPADQPELDGLEPAEPTADPADPAEPVDPAKPKKPRKTPSTKGKPMPIEFNLQTLTFTGPMDEHRERWERVFPGVNVEAELVRAAAWVADKPSHAKQNYLRFLTNWMSRAHLNTPAMRRGESHVPAPASYRDRRESRVAEIFRRASE